MNGTIDIICDKCGASVNSTVGMNLQSFRAFIKKRRGWSFFQGKDYCPSCTKSPNKASRGIR